MEEQRFVGIDEKLVEGEPGRSGEPWISVENR